LKFRKDPSTFRPLIQRFGLGLDVSNGDLIKDGLTEDTLQELTRSDLRDVAVSNLDDFYVIHNHWPPRAGDVANYVHFGEESLLLATLLKERIGLFQNKRVLDLGCSSGSLSLVVADTAGKVLGLDISERSIQWAKLLAEQYHLPHLEFASVGVGSKEAEKTVGAVKWNIAIFNPPMVIPSADASYPHRDGGKLGLELPLKFLDFAAKHLSAGGDALFLATNPIVNGQPAFLNELKKRSTWKLEFKKRLHSQFNANQGISNIELLFLHLKRK